MAVELVYGPSETRRLGLSLGINPLGVEKICSFDCPYCSLGRTRVRLNQLKKNVTFPEIHEIETALRDKLQLHSLSGRQLDTIAISGNGEPTLYPNFLELVEKVLQIRQEVLPRTPVVILSNGAHIDSRKMVHALDLLDERMIKLDVGSDHEFKQMNSPLIRANLSKVIEGARKLRDRIVQTIILTGRIDNTISPALEEWMEAVGLISPKEVHLYTLKESSEDPSLLAANEDLLYTVASKLKRRSQVEIKVFA